MMGALELTPTQFAALARLRELGDTTQNQLGRLTAMDPATIQGVIQRLLLREMDRMPYEVQFLAIARQEVRTGGIALIAGVQLAAARIVGEVVEAGE